MLFFINYPVLSGTRKKKKKKRFIKFFKNTKTNLCFNLLVKSLLLSYKTFNKLFFLLLKLMWWAYTFISVLYKV